MRKLILVVFIFFFITVAGLFVSLFRVQKGYSTVVESTVLSKIPLVKEIAYQKTGIDTSIEMQSTVLPQVTLNDPILMDKFLSSISMPKLGTIIDPQLGTQFILGTDWIKLTTPIHHFKITLTDKQPVKGAAPVYIDQNGQSVLAYERTVYSQEENNYLELRIYINPVLIPTDKQRALRYISDIIAFHLVELASTTVPETQSQQFIQNHMAVFVNPNSAPLFIKYI